MIRGLIDCIRTVIDEWHAKNLEFFCYEPSGDDNSPKRYAMGLAYHNYQAWHYEALMRAADKEQVVAATRMTFIHNNGRNHNIERLDNLFFQLQKGEGEFYSETLAMILDRLSILYLKLKHCQPQNLRRHKSLTQQFAFLSKCAESLFEDLLAGRKQIVVFERTKHFDAEEVPC